MIRREQYLAVIHCFHALRLSAVALATLLAAHAAPALDIKPTRGELQAEKAWLKQHLLDCKLKPGQLKPVELTPPTPEPGLEVLANNDAVTPNGRGTHRMKIGDKEYSRGLYCHAVSKVEVRLPGPGKSFTAVVGLDHNDDTKRGKGSVIFTVRVKDKVAFQSEVMRFGTPAREVNVDLGGADLFTLDIGDVGDGIGWDQCDWADAKVTLADGKELWLGDMPLRDRRTDAGFAPISRTSELPISFVYGGQSSDDLLATWPKKSAKQKLDSSRTQHTFTWTDPQTGLEVRCVAVEYSDFPVAEWTVFFKNTGKTDTAILENIQALDTKFELKPGDRSAAVVGDPAAARSTSQPAAAGPKDTAALRRSQPDEFVLHGNKGDWCVAQSYEPYQVTLKPKSTQRFAPDGGRPTNGPKGWPYFNLQMPGGGMIFAIGWPGQWACSFTRDDRRGLRIVAGQQLTHLLLKPGEEIRTPLIAALFWQGTDTVRAQNLWRRWFMAHNIPRLNGKNPPTMLQMQCYRTFEKGGEQDLFDTVKEFNSAGIPFDLCWRDAGWYPCKGSWPNTGTWELDGQRYPKGWRPFSDWLHQQNKKFIVWFEPERVGDRDSWLAKNHPDWIIGGNLLNLGHPDAWKWLVEHIDKMLVEQGIDYYRQDFNMDPLGNWRGQDAPNRRGMTEIKYVTGYLAFWDELRRRHPGMLIDSCASGGRRNDLETLRRSVPLLRSDFQFGEGATMPNQGHTHGISSWIPYYGSGCYFTDTYSARSYIMPCTGYGGTNAATRRAYEEARQVAPYMLGDYYPLTPYSIQPGDWIAWQFDRPDLNGGVVQAFRRDKNESPTQVLRLAGLAPSTQYEITDLDGAAPRKMTGKALMEQGLAVELKTKPGSAVIFYKKAK
ncbi:MAG: NPCBM/NEW2 domain-containing protein [Verrucomicrobia bacterium]|nr:NPCBM/NEW2 domain-containing protein [Verrucomicrobiota bacterium]